MTTYRLKTPKEGEVKKEGNFTYKFINGKWRVIHYKCDEFEYWQEYNNKGHLIHFKNNEGFESQRAYDDKGHLIHYKNNIGIEEWYDDKGNNIYYKDDEFEYWCEYDDKGNKITEEEFNKIWEKIE